MKSSSKDVAWRLRSAAVAGLGLALSASGWATSTDGFHSVQVVPVVVSTGSFSSEIYVFNPYEESGITVNFKYYPAVSTTQATALDCGDKNLPAFSTVQYTLASLCPGLAAGSNFGHLEGTSTDAENPVFNVYVRVNNPQGQGFSIEGFPPHTFTPATMLVTGLKRQAAAPGYLTNCFFGALGEATTIQWRLDDANGNPVGTVQNVALGARQSVRVYDVFAEVGAAAGDHANVRLQATEIQGTSANEPGAYVFCTVQNNVTFDADFRIGKAFNSADASVVSDDHNRRTVSESFMTVGYAGALPVQDPFVLGTFPNARNRHAVHFKHPDHVTCSLSPPPPPAPQDITGLEMRLVGVDSAFAEVEVAGGSDLTGFAKTYLGDKGTINRGANARWFIDVEATDASGDGKLYTITCTSGSGHGSYEWIGRNLPNAF